MKWLAMCAAAMMLAGCHGGGASADSGKGADAKTDKKEDTKKDKGSIKLDTGAQQRAGLKLIQVEHRQISGQLHAAGHLTLNEERTAHVGAITDGRVTELLVRVGDNVRLGQVLAHFHSHDVHETRAAYEKALAEVVRQKGTLLFAQRNRDRYHRLYDIKSASLQEVEQSEANLRSAQTDLENANIEVEKEKAHLTEYLQISLGPDGRLTEGQEFIPVKSPLNGVVTARPVTVGSVISAGDELYTVADLSSLWMIASVNETDLSKLRVGRPAEVRVQAFPDVAFRGILAYLGKELDPTTRTLQVRVLVPNTGQRLRPEMYATAEFPESQTRAAVFLPEEALQDLNGNTVVFVRKGEDQFEPRPVKLGKRDSGEVEIIAGVNPGEHAVVKGGFLLKSQMLKGTFEGE